MKKFYIVVGIPLCMWTIALAIENKSLNYIFLNFLLAVPLVPMLFADLVADLFDLFKDDMKVSVEDTIETDRLAQQSELLNKHYEETTLMVKPNIIDVSTNNNVKN